MGRVWTPGGLVNGGMIISGHALVNGGIIRAHTAGGIPALQDAVAYWKMEEATGASRLDSTANATTLTDHASVAQAAGKLGNAAQFTGASSMYLSAVTNANITIDLTTAFTIICWWRVTATTGTQYIYAKGANAANGLEYSLKVSSGTLYFTIGKNSAYPLNINDSTLGTPSVDTWYFTACWHTTSIPHTFYIETNRSAGPTTAAADGVNPAADDFNVGALKGGSFLTGMVDSLGIWKRVLSSGELDQLYAAGVGTDAF